MQQGDRDASIRQADAPVGGVERSSGGNARTTLSRRDVLRGMAAAGALIGPGRSLLTRPATKVPAAASRLRPDATGGTTLNGWMWQPIPGTYDSVLAADAKVWEKSSGDVLNLQSVDYSDYFTKFSTAAAGGVPPDFLEMNWAGIIVTLIRQKTLQPMDSILTQPGFPKLFPSVVASTQFFGHTYAIPMDVNSLTIAYNKEMFAKAKVTPPRTHAELLALNSKLTAAGYPGLAFSIADGWPCGDIWFAQMAYEGVLDQDIKQAELGNMKWTAAPFLTAAKRATQLRPLLVSSDTSITTTEAATLFAKEQASMFYPVGNFDTPLITSVNPSLEFGTFPFPPPSASMMPRATGGPAVIWSVAAKSRHLSEIGEYLGVVMSPAGLTRLVKNGYYPATAAADLSQNSSPLYRELGKWQQTIATRAIFLPNTYNALLTGMQSLLLGKSTPEAMVQGLAAAAKTEPSLSHL